MSVAARPSRVSTPERGDGGRTARKAFVDTPVAAPSPAEPSPAGPTRAAPRVAGRQHGPATLFEVPFTSEMSDADIAVLVRALDLTTHMHPKLHGHPTSPGAVRLDHQSGLFLERGALDGRWVLEGRSWGRPASESVHEWHVLAAGAARLLDPVVDFPDRLAGVPLEYPLRPVGWAANRRLAGFRRRITGAY